MSNNVLIERTRFAEPVGNLQLHVSKNTSFPRLFLDRVDLSLKVLTRKKYGKYKKRAES